MVSYQFYSEETILPRFLTYFLKWTKTRRGKETFPESLIQDSAFGVQDWILDPDKTFCRDFKRFRFFFKNVLEYQNGSKFVIGVVWSTLSYYLIKMLGLSKRASYSNDLKNNWDAFKIKNIFKLFRYAIKWMIRALSG